MRHVYEVREVFEKSGLPPDPREPPWSLRTLGPFAAPAKLVRAKQDGRSGGTRTHGPRFWRPMLYQLSYTPAARAGHLAGGARGRKADRGAAGGPLRRRRAFPDR